MKTPSRHVYIPVLLIFLLCACELNPAPTPTSTLVASTITFAISFTPTASATPTQVPAFTPKASSTPAPTTPPEPINTLAVSPTPVPGWTTYTNEDLGYSFNHPAGARISETGAGGMDLNEVIPPGFTFDEYFDYVMTILPKDLCVSVGIPGAAITIAPPSPIGRYVGPCPGLGIGSQYNITQIHTSWWIAGREYADWMGMRLDLKDTGVFYSEIFIFEMQNGFRIIYLGMPHGEMPLEQYQAQKSIAMEMLSTLHWFKVPDLTKPGTTCAGSSTRLVPGEAVRVTGSPSDPPNRVRAEPNLAAEVISQVYPGTILDVVEGPICADEMVFWKVAQPLIPGGSGWTAEGNGAEYWLEPYRP